MTEAPNGMKLVTLDNVGNLFDSFGIDRELMKIRHNPYGGSCPFREGNDDCSSSCIIGNATDDYGSSIGSNLCPMYRITSGKLCSDKMYVTSSLLDDQIVDDL